MGGWCCTHCRSGRKVTRTMGRDVNGSSVQRPGQWRQFSGAPLAALQEERRFSPTTLIVLGVIGVIILGALIVGGIALYQAMNPPVITPTATARFQQTFAVGNAPDVVVQGATGDITVTAGPDGQVTILGTKTATGASVSAAYQALSQINVQMSQSHNTITVNIQSTASLLQSDRVELHIAVPHVAVLNFTSKVGRIVIAGVSGIFQLHGNVGDITLNNVTFLSNSIIQTNSGNITFTGRFGGVGAYSLITGTGDVTITLPANASFHLQAQTNNGTIRSQFVNIPASASVGDSVSAMIGSQPNAVIDIQVSSGDIAVNRQ